MATASEISLLSSNNNNESIDDINHQNVDQNNLAVQGYDLTEYFSNNRAVKGTKDFQFVHRGIKYNFITDKNMKKFSKAPENYIPQFGGYCAYGFAFDDKGRGRLGKYSINPKSFKITDGKLYLFYKAWGSDALLDWNKAESQYIHKAIKVWKEIVKGERADILDK